ncbi:MAG: diguanylate cyclase [Rhodopseudomonas sp.]|nr:diguanylate cyclase [Rhodopseudomonas sp.]
MFDAAMINPDLLDVPTLMFAAACIIGFLGLFMVVNWLQQREVGALAWWGAAYLIGAAAIGLRGAPTPMVAIAPVWPEALVFVACGMVWNGVRLFHGRKLWPAAIFAGAGLWLAVAWLPGLEPGSYARIMAGVVIVAVYSLCIAGELVRERRRSLYSRGTAIAVPLLYTVTFLLPLAMRMLFPDVVAERWLTIMALETIIYAVGTAFIVLLMVKDHHVHFYRQAATTDSLTGLLNRGAFLAAANALQARQGPRGEPVTLLMFDLDKFKSINDRFGHAIGDSVLRVFAQVARTSMRATDILGRLGGEEFVAMVPEPMEGAVNVAERLRAGFEAAGVIVDGLAIGATVSSGLATSYRVEPDIDSLLLRADAALYRAKNDGRNRFVCADEEPGSEQARARAQASKAAGLKRRWVARRPKPGDAPAAG